MVMDEYTHQARISYRFYRYWDLQVMRPKAIVRKTGLAA